MPNRQQRAQATRDHALHQLRQAALMDAETELADQLESERQFWASLARQHEEQARYAHLQAEECARRQAQHLIRVDAEAETPVTALAAVNPG
jgi:hypothetical protein